MITLLVYLCVSAGVLGTVVLFMEDEFPEWVHLLLISFAASVLQVIVGAVIPDEWGWFGVLPQAIVGAATAGVGLSYVFGMTLQRACVAGAVYMVVMVGLLVFFASQLA